MQWRWGAEMLSLSVNISCVTHLIRMAHAKSGQYGAAVVVLVGDDTLASGKLVEDGAPAFYSLRRYHRRDDDSFEPLRNATNVTYFVTAEDHL